MVVTLLVFLMTGADAGPRARQLRAMRIAQKSLGTSSSRETLSDVVRSWRGKSFGGVRGASLPCKSTCFHQYTTLAYKRIYKNGNNAITSNLNVFPDFKCRIPTQSMEKPSTCSFTFIREPFDRLVSGLNEFEYRLQKNGNDRKHLSQSVFNKYPLGSEDRVIQLLADFVSGRVLNGKGKVAGGLTANDSIVHIYPQSNGFINKTAFDFIGHIERAHEHWTRMQKHCGVPENLVRPLDTSKGQHPTSKDLYGVRRAAAQALKRPHVQRAVCMMYINDYITLRYKFPRACSSVMSSFRPNQQAVAF